MPSNNTRGFFALVKGFERPQVRRLVGTSQVYAEIGHLVSKQSERFFGSGDLEEIEYSVDYSIRDHTEVFVIKDYPLPPELADLAGAAEGPPPLSEDELAGGKLLSVFAMGHRDGALRELLFQYIDSRQVLRKDVAFFWSNDTFKKLDGTAVALKDELAAVYKDGNLFFRKEQLVRRFLSLDVVFNEASGPSLKEFLSNKLFYVEDVDAAMSATDSRIRRRISSLLERKVLERVSAKKIQKEAAERLGLKIKVKGRGEGAKIVFPADRKSMKQLLAVISEDVFDGILTGDPFETNSKRPRKK